MTQLLLPILTAFFIALCSGLMLLQMRQTLSPLTKARNDQLAVQASHVGNPMRLGGLAAIIGLMAAILTQVFTSSFTIPLLIVASVVPVLFAGLWEDLGHGMSAKGRFYSAALSSSIAVSLLGLWVPRGDLPGLNAVMGFVPAGVFVTVFVAAVYCHAVNLIDGMNGLAATVVILSAIGLAIIASTAELPELVCFSILIGAATFGFQLLNWPVAKLFLGDAGAYSLGHFLVWIGISLIALEPNVAVPAVLLVLFYPLADTLHTVFRRVLEGKGVTLPDRMHLHQKIRRGLEVVWIGRNRRHISNPLTTVVLLPFIAAPVLAGVLFWNQPKTAWIFLLGFLIAFAGANLIVVLLAQRYRKKIKP